MTSITESELLDAIRAATKSGHSDEHADAMTGPEMALAIGITESPMRVRIRRMITAGVLECVRVKRTSMSGVTTSVPGYRLVAKPKQAKR